MDRRKRMAKGRLLPISIIGRRLHAYWGHPVSMRPPAPPATHLSVLARYPTGLLTVEEIDALLLTFHDVH